MWNERPRPEAVEKGAGGSAVGGDQSSVDAMGWKTLLSKQNRV